MILMWTSMNTRIISLLSIAWRAYGKFIDESSITLGALFASKYLENRW